MSESIHRKGTGAEARYRLWYSIPDAYGCEAMTRAEMASYLLDREHQPDTVAVEARLARADAHGTSAWDDERDASAWDTERCGVCARFHHAFAPRPLDGLCGGCGDEADDVSHRPSCAPT